MLEINEHNIKLVGSACLPEGLEENKDYLVSIEGSVDKISDKNNNDGTKARTYNLKIQNCEVLKDNGETIKGKTKRSPSQDLRWALKYEYEARDIEKKGMDFEDWYPQIMKRMTSKLPDIMDLIK